MPPLLASLQRAAASLLESTCQVCSNCRKPRPLSAFLSLSCLFVPFLSLAGSASGCICRRSARLCRYAGCLSLSPRVLRCARFVCAPLFRRDAAAAAAAFAAPHCSSFSRLSLSRSSSDEKMGNCWTAHDKAEQGSREQAPIKLPRRDADTRVRADAQPVDLNSCSSSDESVAVIDLRELLHKGVECHGQSSSLILRLEAGERKWTSERADAASRSLCLHPHGSLVAAPLCSGSDTLHMRIYPAADGATSREESQHAPSQLTQLVASEKGTPNEEQLATVQLSPATQPAAHNHPMVHPQEDHLRYAREVEFIRTLIAEATSQQHAEWEITVSSSPHAAAATALAAQSSPQLQSLCLWLT